jgi:hypothetical protein
MTFIQLDRWSTGRLVGVLCAAAVATLFAIGQALTFAWLSALPEQASRLDALAWRFWIYAALALMLAVSDLWLVSVLLRRLLRRSSRHDDAKGPTSGHHV